MEMHQWESISTLTKEPIISHSKFLVLTCYLCTPTYTYVCIGASGEPNTLPSNRVFIRSCHLPFSAGQWRKELAWDTKANKKSLAFQFQKPFAKLPSQSCLISDTQLTGDRLKPSASLVWTPSCNGSRMASLSKDDPSLVRLSFLIVSSTNKTWYIVQDHGLTIIALHNRKCSIS